MAPAPILLLAAPVVFLVLIALVMSALFRRHRGRRHHGRSGVVVVVVLMGIVAFAGLAAVAMLLTARTVFIEATTSSEEGSSYAYHSTRELKIESGPDYVGITRIDGGTSAPGADEAPGEGIDRLDSPRHPAAPPFFQPPFLPPKGRMTPPIGRTMPPPLRYALSAGALALLIGVAYLFIDAPNRGRYTWLRRASWALAFLAVCLLVWRAGLVFGTG